MNYQSIKDKILQGQQKMTRKELLFLVGDVERRSCYFQARLKENYTRNAKLEDEISKLKKSLLAMKQGLDYAYRDIETAKELLENVCFMDAIEE